ncbi:solute carrier family 15 member 4 [Lingula anatina]|uniref:Solute carrier family 15 member 4 n=1 Tax=Lingula anatina TaxID=7574 RepID=A0A1S3J3R1_LINAN|nr:solute carrier family 15 member 4 [Lingula anatina]|eukprot:XP_013404504.1 solute carrier family 15 member 4 [Lingula anatina]
MAFSKSALLVLLALMCERAAYFTVENHVNELWTKTSNSSNTTDDAVIAHMMFVGASACFGIFGGAFADAFLHPIPTLGVGYVVYSIGLVLLECAAYEAKANLSAARDLVIAGLVSTALGQGCIGAVLPVVGAAQVPNENNRRRFIHWYYVWRNVGAIIADTSSAVFDKDELYDKYWIAPVSGVLSDILVLTAILVRKKPPEENRPDSTCTEGTALPNVLSSAFQLCRNGCLLSTSYRRRENISRRSNLRAVFRILLVNSAVVGFGFLYLPILTVYEMQASGLNGNITGDKFEFPSPSTQLILFNEVVIVFVIPFTLYCLYPRIWPRGGPHYISKTSIGVVFSIISGLVAIVLETVRKNYSKHNHGCSTISIFAQGPQYTLIALAEVFTQLTVMEYSYMEAPDGIKCFSMGLHQTALGLSYFIAVGIEALVTETQPGWHLFDVEDICFGASHLECFLGILVLLNVVFSLIFPLVTRIPQERPDYIRLI